VATASAYGGLAAIAGGMILTTRARLERDSRSVLGLVLLVVGAALVVTSFALYFAGGSHDVPF
jgi:uncharacterized membrane protein HdeD (DUF308 family)